MTEDPDPIKPLSEHVCGPDCHEPMAALLDISALGEPILKSRAVPTCIPIGGEMVSGVLLEIHGESGGKLYTFWSPDSAHRFLDDLLQAVIASMQLASDVKHGGPGAN